MTYHDKIKRIETDTHDLSWQGQVYRNWHTWLTMTRSSVQKLTHMTYHDKVKHTETDTHEFPWQGQMHRNWHTWLPWQGQMYRNWLTWLTMTKSNVQKLTHMPYHDRSNVQKLTPMTYQDKVKCTDADTHDLHKKHSHIRHQNCCSTKSDANTQKA